MRNTLCNVGIVFLIGIFIGYSLLNANVLQNPGFEDGMNAWQATTGSVSIISDSMGVRNGNNSLLTSLVGTVGFEQIGVPVEPNTWYRLTVHSKGQHGLDWRFGLGYMNAWSKLYVDGAELYHAWHSWYSYSWLQEDWTMFNTGPRTTIDITLERWVGDFPPGTSGIVYDDIILVPYEMIRPWMLSAVASDGDIPGVGIDDDDYVTLTFSEPANKISIHRFFDTGIPPHREHPIDIVFKLLSGHTWLDGNGNIKEAVWNASGDTLIVYLSTEGGLPTIQVGDTIRPGRCEILDESGNPILRDVVMLTGSFGLVGAEETTISRPLKLFQNCPNPFNASTSISYQLPYDQSVCLKIYDIYGSLVKALVDGHQSADFYVVIWDGKDKLGRESPAGIYFYRFKAGDFLAARKMILLRR